MKKKAVFLASMVILLILAGCQSVEEQVGKKVAENMLGQALGGDVKVTEDGSVNIKTAEGEANIGAGDTRPASIPQDLPNLPNGNGFTWMGNADGGWFVYEMTGTDLKKACDDQIQLMTAAGWQEKTSSFVMESADNITKNYSKPGFNSTVSCSIVDDKISFMITKAKDDLGSSDEDSSSTDSDDTSSEDTTESTSES